MKWLDEVRSIEITEIRKPADWDAVLAEERTKALAANLAQTDGPVNLPVLNAATMDIVAGKHRIAACSLAGRPRVQVRLVNCSAAKERLLRASDNAFPRDDYDAWIHELVAARAAVIEEEKAQRSEPDKSSTSPHRTVKGEARADVAAMLGKTPEAVRKADERAGRPKKLDVRIKDADGTETPWAEPAEGTNGHAPPVPKPRSFEARLKDFLPKPHQDPDCPLNDLLIALKDAQAWAKPWAGNRDQRNRLLAAAQVFMYAQEADELLVRVWDKANEVVRLLGIIHAQTHSQADNTVTARPKTGLRGAPL